MKHNLIPTAYKLYQTYKYYILRGGAFLLVLGAGCCLSYTAGQRSRSIPEHVAATPNQASPEQAKAQTKALPVLNGSPSFAFPSYAAAIEATPANAELMSPKLLNLAYLYEDGADTSDPASSYGGRLYSRLSQKDARWAAGLNDLYHYTPKRLAAQMGLPIQTVTAGSEVIPEFTKVSMRFLDGDGKPVSHTSNAKDIIAMANTLYYYGVLNSMDELEAYTDRMWELSHHYSPQMGEIYDCDECTPAAQETEDVAEESSQGEAQEEDTVSSQGPGMTVPSSDSAAKASTEERGEEEALSPSIGTPSQPEAPPCPGHIDLTITVEIKGISEAHGLFSADPTASSGDKPSGWKGWNEPAVESVRTVSGQDWYEKYGINTADSLLCTPLTAGDIQAYMNMVPEETSQMRKDFIRYALTSVGKIPYYWGGKPEAPGYTGNDFGSIVSPDEDGRFLKGLDCSGWINWLYWSITGHGLGAESTGTLISSGTATTKSGLLPGDLCIRTGAMPHVVVFLAWAPDGQMVCIQETSGNINNVEVGTTTGDWQSYRSILD